MKLLILGLSATFGTLSGLFYDIRPPVLAPLPLSLSGPALATALAVFLIVSSLLTGTQMILGRLETLIALQRKVGPIDMPKEIMQSSMVTTTQADMVGNVTQLRTPVRLPAVDLEHLVLRAER